MLRLIKHALKLLLRLDLRVLEEHQDTCLLEEYELSDMGFHLMRWEDCPLRIAARSRYNEYH